MAAFAEAKEATLVCKGYSGTTELSDFQVLVKLTGDNYGFSYGDYPQQDGSDLWFTDSAGNLIPHEIDTWNPNGDSFVWVKIPTLADSATQIVMHWGAERTAGQISAENVWPNHVGVWHIGKTVPGAAVSPTELDSTGHGLDAYGEGANASAVAAMTETSGKVGNGRVNANNNGLRVPDFRSYITDQAKFTVSGWWSGTSKARLFSARGNPANNSINNYWELYGGLQALCVAFGDGTHWQDKANMNNDSTAFIYKGNTSTDWTYVSLSYDGGTARLYVAGRNVATYTVSFSNTAPTWGFKIGNIGNTLGWVGNYDEVRMFDGVSSADRIAADYATMSSPEEFLLLSDVITTAVWTGGGNDNDFLNPQNWSCTNTVGVCVEDALPGEQTDVIFAGDGLDVQIPAGFSQVYRSISIGDCTLAADCDWRGLPDFTITGTVNLDGHKLYLAKVAGTGTVTDDTPSGEIVADGSFEDITGTVADRGSGMYFSDFSANGAPVLNRWTLSNVTDAGIVRALGGGDPWAYGQKAPDGENALYFQNVRSVSQQITVPSAGKYIVSFWYKTRWDGRTNEKNRNYSGARIRVRIGDVVIGDGLCRECVSDTAERPFTKFCAETFLEAGERTLSVDIVFPAGVTGTGTCEEVIDCISVRPANYGELHLDSSADILNSTVGFAGTMKLVKEGTGTYSAAKANQSYSGGTEIREGTVQMDNLGTRLPFGAEGSSIVVSTNGVAKGVLEMNGINNGYIKRDYSRYIIVLNGGRIQNTGYDVSASITQLKNVRLTADSEWYARRNFGLLDFYSGRNSDQKTMLDLNGHVLSMQVAGGIHFLIRNATVLTGDGGDIETDGDFFFNVWAGSSGVVATNLDLDVTYRLLLSDSLSVRDYTAAYSGTYGSGSSALKVGGTFKPTVSRFYGPTMQDGSTLDLTAWPEAAGWPVNSRYALGPTNVYFAAGATVKVRLDGRDDISELAGTKVNGEKAGYLIKWQNGSAPSDNVTFVLEGDCAKVYELSKTDIGLLLSFRPGLIISVR